METYYGKDLTKYKLEIEMTFDRQWYLVGLPETRLDGLTVRI